MAAGAVAISPIFGGARQSGLGADVVNIVNQPHFRAGGVIFDMNAKTVVGAFARGPDGCRHMSVAEQETAIDQVHLDVAAVALAEIEFLPLHHARRDPHGAGVRDVGHCFRPEIRFGPAFVARNHSGGGPSVIFAHLCPCLQKGHAAMPRYRRTGSLVN